MEITKQWTIRNVPTHILVRIRKQAAENHRSLNGEMIAILDNGSKRKEGGK